MTIERRGGEIIIKISDNIDVNSLQRLLDYLKFSEITEKSNVNQKSLDELSSKVNKDWWNANKDRFLNQ